MIPDGGRSDSEFILRLSAVACLLLFIPDAEAVGVELRLRHNIRAFRL